MKTDFGDEAAGELLRQARRASDACDMANNVLQHMPQALTDGVERFDLSILFSANGLPEVCVVARRSADEFEGAAINAGGGGELAAFSSSPSAGIWEVENFWQDRLPSLYDSLSTSGPLKLCADSEDRDEIAKSCRSWESRVCKDIGILDYRSLLLENERLEQSLRETQEALDAAVAAKAAGKRHARSRLSFQASPLGKVFRGLNRSSSASRLAAPDKGVPASPRGRLALS